MIIRGRIARLGEQAVVRRERERSEALALLLRRHLAETLSMARELQQETSILDTREGAAVRQVFNELADALHEHVQRIAESAERLGRVARPGEAGAMGSRFNL